MLVEVMSNREIQNALPKTSSSTVIKAWYATREKHFSRQITCIVAVLFRHLRHRIKTQQHSFEF
jgi:hypothetical protein